MIRIVLSGDQVARMQNVWDVKKDMRGRKALLRLKGEIKIQLRILKFSYHYLHIFILLVASFGLEWGCDFRVFIV
jgi:hypothetical protein